MQAFEEALNTFDQMRRGYLNDQSKLMAMNKNIDVFETGIQAAIELDKFTGQDQARAFRFLEKSKASLLMEAMQSGIAKAAAMIPSSLLKKEEALSIHLTLLNKRIEQLSLKTSKEPANKETKQALEAAQSEFFDVFQAYTLRLEQLETNYPDYYQLKYATQTANIEDLQTQLAENQALVNYFVGTDTIYIFVVTEFDFEVAEIDKPDVFKQLINDFLAAINQHNRKQYIKLAHQLYKLLIAPVEPYWQDPAAALLGEEFSELQQLIIIPHAELTYLPFEALLKSPTAHPSISPPSARSSVSLEQNHATANNSYQHLDYLLNHYEISYHYSATLWLYQQQKDSLQYETEHSFAGFAPIYDTTPNAADNTTHKALQTTAESCRAWATRSEALRADGTFVSLPYSENEVKNIETLFKKNGLQADTFLRKQATKNNFSKKARQAKYLLVAAHGLVNDEQTALSGLVFYPDESSPQPPPKGELRSAILQKDKQQPNHQSPVTNHQSPVTNHQSPVTNTKTTVSYLWKRPIT